MTRALAIWLDGFDMKLAGQWRLPTLARLAGTSAHCRLNSGSAQLSGLTGEHLATGKDPAESRRASAVHFDPEAYTVRQRGTATRTAFGGVPSVVFDPCYFNLRASPPSVLGLTDWGSHDPGGPAEERPGGLHAEIVERFGAYPARPWIYASPYASSEKCSRMGSDLVAGVQARSRIAQWLLGERLTDWQLAFVGVSEAHSASEGLLHGADPAHPLRSIPSAPAAGRALRSVYESIDQMVAELMEEFPDANTMVFTMHGMGINSGDVASMVALGELVARWSGEATPDVTWPLYQGELPLLAEDESWTPAVEGALGMTASPGRSLVRRAVPVGVRRAIWNSRDSKSAKAIGPGQSLSWMPVTRHRSLWPSMRAFVLPSFYDGRIRVNLAGREAHGIVNPDAYADLLDELESLVRACHDPVSGESAVADVQRPLDDPLFAADTDADLVVCWAGMPLGLAHPQLGTVGPFPPRRTGGHTSPWGACFMQGPDIATGDLGVRSSFDALPTLFDLAACPSPWPLSGESMMVTSASADRPSS